MTGAGFMADGAHDVRACPAVVEGVAHRFAIEGHARVLGGELGIPGTRRWEGGSRSTPRNAQQRHPLLTPRAYLDFCVLRHSMSLKKDMYATQDDEESPGRSIGATA